MMKIAVYSCLIGDVDEPLDIENEEGIDYIMFSDKKHKANGWVYKDIPREAFETSTDPRRQSRYLKINSHIALPDYDYTIYIDANILPNRPIKTFIEAMEDKFILLKDHPTRNCIYHEAKVIKKYNFDSCQIVDKAISFLKKQGFPKNFGLTENGFIVRKSNKIITQLNELWWDVYCKYSRRDQLSLMYCLWKLDIKTIIVPNNVVKWYAHKKNTRVLNNEK